MYYYTFNMHNSIRAACVRVCYYACTVYTTTSDVYRRFLPHGLAILIVGCYRQCCRGTDDTNEPLKE